MDKLQRLKISAKNIKGRIGHPWNDETDEESKDRLIECLEKQIIILEGRVEELRKDDQALPIAGVGGSLCSGFKPRTDYSSGYCAECGQHFREHQ